MKLREEWERIHFLRNLYLQSPAFSTTAGGARSVLAGGVAPVTVQNGKLAKKVYYVIAAIGDVQLAGSKLTAKNWEALIKQEAYVYESGQKKFIHEGTVFEDGFTTNQLLNAIPQNLTESDVLVVVVLTHGRIDREDHVLTTVGGEVSRLDIRKKMTASKAGAVWLITEACAQRSGSGSVNVRAFNVVAALPRFSCLRTLLLTQKGTLSVNMCSPGQFCVYNSGFGGWGSDGLLSAFSQETPTTGVNWADLQESTRVSMKRRYDDAVNAGDRVVITIPVPVPYDFINNLEPR